MCEIFFFKIPVFNLNYFYHSFFSFGQNVIQKKYSHFFGAEFEEDINKNLEYIKQNRKLVSIFIYILKRVQI